MSDEPEIETEVVYSDGEHALASYGSTAAEIQAPFYALALKNVGLKFFILYNLDNASRQSAISELMDMLVKGVLKHNMASIFTLDETAAAHEWVEQGKGAGNVVIKTQASNA